MYVTTAVMYIKGACTLGAWGTCGNLGHEKKTPILDFWPCGRSDRPQRHNITWLY